MMLKNEINKSIKWQQIVYIILLSDFFYFLTQYIVSMFLLLLTVFLC